jgi:hypothetical protein
MTPLTTRRLGNAEVLLTFRRGGRLRRDGRLTAADQA